MGWRLIITFIFVNWTLVGCCLIGNHTTSCYVHIGQYIHLQKTEVFFAEVYQLIKYFILSFIIHINKLPLHILAIKANKLNVLYKTLKAKYEGVNLKKKGEKIIIVNYILSFKFSMYRTQHQLVPTFFLFKLFPINSMNFCQLLLIK